MHAQIFKIIKPQLKLSFIDSIKTPNEEINPHVDGRKVNNLSTNYFKHITF